ncbi:hypothetical protein M8818_002909 [Zalaria obscura]|uniref:Uncharacterized protein n=1 Tax=Zalaria obscura TaxID=2024903 RepID=A0ACC3SHS3_9PEZI
MVISATLNTGADVRLAARNNKHTSSTSGLAPSYLQANLIVLPSRYAADFRTLCTRNPVPCPLLAESATVGSFNALKSYIPSISGEKVAADIDIRHDAPRYNIYQESKLAAFEVPDIAAQWTDDHVAFLIGCSYSFETALTEAGLPPRHTVMGRNVPMYRTSVPLCPAGVFTGSTYVVSMRPYRRSDVETVREITRRFVTTHGEPIAWGWEAVRRFGIEDVASPEWGEKPLALDGGDFVDDGDYVPVFWGCGVTPQEAVMRAGLEGTVMGHAPGHMIVLDVTEDEVFGTAKAKINRKLGLTV